MRGQGMNYWAFILNPGIFKVEDVVEKAIREQEEVYWLVGNRKVRKGDRAIIWKTKGNKTKNNKQRSGIIALAEVLEDPKLMKDPDRDGWVKQNKADEVANRVRIRYLVSPNLPLWEGKTNLKVLEEEKLIVQKPNIQGPAFHIQTKQWEAIMEAIGSWPDKPPELENAELVLAELVGKNQSGQGFRMGVAERHAIEHHAMEAAKNYYEERGWSVTDVSATCSYDLVCKRNNGEELHVEVKGTTSDGKQILLTRNEVIHAQNYYPRVALFVLAHIQIDQTSTGKPQASGGKIQLLDPWNVDEKMLSSLAYAYRIPEKDIEEEK